MSEGLVYVGKIVELGDILNADFISSATVVCGRGGRWRGVVQKNQFRLGDICIVYLPDAQIPPNDEMKFMERSKWRVRMCKFRGAPSEVLITKAPVHYFPEVGTDLTEHFNVTKYCKPVPANMQGKAKGPFPGFVPKTDEPNYQSNPDLVDSLHGLPYYVTEKADGSSTTAFRYKGNFGVCSRNWELEENSDNGFWKVAEKYALKEKLPDGYAIQWETVGPNIQKNPMGFSEVDGRAFSVFSIPEHRYLNMKEFVSFCDHIKFPMVNIIELGDSFDKEKVSTMGEGQYENGHEMEGVVVRAQHHDRADRIISFKVINLNYET